MVNRELGLVINGNSNYSNYTFDPLTFSCLLSFGPLIYIIPTFVVIIRVIRTFYRNIIGKKDKNFNRNVFTVLVLSNFSSLGFFFSDLIVIRAPSTGIMTSWCYRQEPNRFLNIVFQAQAYFNYCTMLYPVLFSVVRLVITYVPNRHDEVNAKILKFAIPAIQIYPLLLLLHMIPALGVCRQHSSPYSFGAVYVHFINSWRGIMNAPITVINSAVWLTTCLILNFILYRKLRKLKTVSLSQSQTHQNIRNRIIEVSLSLTTLAMLFAYATNLVFLGSFMIDYDIATYLVVFRPFGYDLELCVVPWVFYLTHPAFRKKSDSRIVVNSNRKPPLSV
ncbi:CRE-SRU-19 protein [Caenorhabditis remanei]|uniref:CRE-SRU-19 protein n=1 Tax=Caenorhabditis remanei TaxID=31234 RepID=E3MMB6_CAERE|nr:CRE-SRU-19 protein [Caenorhabditis remanei]